MAILILVYQQLYWSNCNKYSTEETALSLPPYDNATWYTLSFSWLKHQSIQQFQPPPAQPQSSNSVYSTKPSWANNRQLTSLSSRPESSYSVRLHLAQSLLTWCQGHKGHGSQTNTRKWPTTQIVCLSYETRVIDANSRAKWFKNFRLSNLVAF